MSRSSIKINSLHTKPAETVQLSPVFQKGDFVVEHAGARSPAAFGVVKGVENAIHGSLVLDVQFPTERLYTFANHCQHYKDWLDENGF